MARVFRKKDRIERDRRNYDLWLAGLYVYHALDAAAPFYAEWTKQESKPYLDAPFPTTDDQGERSKKRREKESIEKAKAFMGAFAAAHNAKLDKAGEKG